MAWTSSTGEKDMTLDCWLESLGKREDRAGWMDGSAAANLGNRQMAALLIPAFAFVHVLCASKQCIGLYSISFHDEVRTMITGPRLRYVG